MGEPELCADCGGGEFDRLSSEFNDDTVCYDCEHDRKVAFIHSRGERIADCSCDFCDSSVPTPAWLASVPSDHITHL